MARRRGDEAVHQLRRRLHDGSLLPSQEGAAHCSPEPHCRAKEGNTLNFGNKRVI